MADLSDVVDAVAALVASAFYPCGPGTQSVLDGVPVKIKAGWPLAAELDAGVAGVKALMPERGIYISVFPPPNLERATTRAMPRWLKIGAPEHTITVALADRTFTLGGVVSVPQNVAITAGDRGYSYGVQAADTLSSIATALAALMVADGVPASALGPTLTVPGIWALGARVGSVQGLAKEVERTQRSIMTTVWAPTGALRARAARIVRARLADTSDLTNCHNRFVPLCDGSAAWIVYDHTNDWDQDQRAGIYRRDISHWFEFGEYVMTQATEVILAEVGTTPSLPTVDPLGNTVTTFA